MLPGQMSPGQMSPGQMLHEQMLHGQLWPGINCNVLIGQILTIFGESCCQALILIYGLVNWTSVT